MSRFSKIIARTRHNLSLQSALLAAFLFVVYLAGWQFLAEQLDSTVATILTIFAVALTTFILVQVLIVKRVEAARKTLRRYRRGKFRQLATRPEPTGGVLNKLARQVFRTGIVMEREIRRLEEVETYRREFLGDVSHELRTPIFAIQGFAETLQDGALEDESVSQAFLEKIVRHAGRLHKLVEDLSYVSMIETGELTMHMGPFPLRPVFDEVMEAFSSRARKVNVTIKENLSPAVPDVMGDRDRILQVISNLVENAIKYNRSDGKVELSAVHSDDRVLISVTDTGIGIPEADLARITDRFFRVDRSRSRQQGGTGLGLSIVRHLLEAHKQRLRIDSTVGIGSTFSFFLPVSREQNHS